MWCRKRIDIGWTDLLAAAVWSLRRPRELAARDAAESAGFPTDAPLATLTVRSGFDLLLQELALPIGSEVLMSAVTIDDLARIVRAHGLVPVPVDIHPSTMMPAPDCVRRAVTSRTRLILVAHLFGAIGDVGPLIEIAHTHGLLFLEDGAQSFDGIRWRGHPDSDVVMFSFGPIKTATALGGGLLLVRDAALRERLRRAQDRWPLQPTAEFFRRVGTAVILKLLSGPLLFGLVMRALRLSGRDPDTTLSGMVRNFPADAFFDRVRRRPCPALLRLMARRLQTFDLGRQDARAGVGAALCEALRDASPEDSLRLSVPSSACPRHTWWVFPLFTDATVDRRRLQRTLARHGFDAAAVSQMRAIAGPDGIRPPEAATVADRLLFLPCDPRMPLTAVAEMAAIVRAEVGNALRPAEADSPVVTGRLTDRGASDQEFGRTGSPASRSPEQS